MAGTAVALRQFGRPVAEFFVQVSIRRSAVCKSTKEVAHSIQQSHDEVRLRGIEQLIDRRDDARPLFLLGLELAPARGGQSVGARSSALPGRAPRAPDPAFLFEAM